MFATAQSTPLLITLLFPPVASWAQIYMVGGALLFGDGARVLFRPAPDYRLSVSPFNAVRVWTVSFRVVCEPIRVPSG
jgi:hypothetical protein